MLNWFKETDKTYNYMSNPHDLEIAKIPFGFFQFVCSAELQSSRILLLLHFPCHKPVAMCRSHCLVALKHDFTEQPLSAAKYSGVLLIFYSKKEYRCLINL